MSSYFQAADTSVEKIANAIKQNGYKQLYDGNYFQYDEDNNLLAACALGQAAKNLGLTPGFVHGYLDNMIWGKINCPSKESCGVRNKPAVKLRYSVGTMITHLNDDHKWKLSTIAKWLRKFEGK